MPVPVSFVGSSTEVQCKQNQLQLLLVKNDLVATLRCPPVSRNIAQSRLVNAGEMMSRVCMWNLVYYSSFSVPACAGVQLWSCNVSWLLFFPYIITARVAWDSTGSGLKGKTRCREYKTDHPELKHRPSEAFLFDSEPAKRHARLVPSDCSCRPKRLGAPVYYNT